MFAPFVLAPQPFLEHQQQQKLSLFLEKDSTFASGTHSDVNLLVSNSSVYDNSWKWSMATSILFQQAANTAADDARYVLYIGKLDRLSQHPPRKYSQREWNKTALERVEMRYAANDVELRNVLVNVHLMAPLPSLLIVDDFSSFFTLLGDKATLYLTLALLKETATFLASHGRPSAAFITEIGEESMLALRLPHYAPWIAHTFLIAGQGGNFQLSLHSSNRLPLHSEQYHQAKVMRLTFKLDSDSFTLADVEC